MTPRDITPNPQSLATVFIIIFVFPSPRPLPCKWLSTVVCHCFYYHFRVSIAPPPSLYKEGGGATETRKMIIKTMASDSGQIAPSVNDPVDFYETYFQRQYCRDIAPIVNAKRCLTMRYHAFVYHDTISKTIQFGTMISRNTMFHSTSIGFISQSTAWQQALSDGKALINKAKRFGTRRKSRRAPLTQFAERRASQPASVRVLVLHPVFDFYAMEQGNAVMDYNNSIIKQSTKNDTLVSLLT